MAEVGARAGGAGDAAEAAATASAGARAEAGARPFPSGSRDKEIPPNIKNTFRVSISPNIRDYSDIT